MCIPKVVRVNELIKHVNKWIRDRGLEQADPRVQLGKLLEETGELAKAVNKDRRDDIIDGIGDVTVVLLVLCAQLDLDFGLCLVEAYKEIKDRKGKLINGMFVKESDLKEEEDGTRKG